MTMTMTMRRPLALAVLLGGGSMVLFAWGGRPDLVPLHWSPRAALTWDEKNIVYTVNRPRTEIWILDGLQVPPSPWHRGGDSQVMARLWRPIAVRATHAPPETVAAYKTAIAELERQLSARTSWQLARLQREAHRPEALLLPGDRTPVG